MNEANLGVQARDVARRMRGLRPEIEDRTVLKLADATGRLADVVGAMADTLGNVERSLANLEARLG